MKDHTFSICAYGESPYLENCIRSLLRQTVESNILIVSSEPNAQILRMSDKYGIPYYRNTGEPGITQDWNFGYHKAHTCYVTIAHQDDIYEKSFLENQMRALKKADHPLIGFTDYYEIRPDGIYVVKTVYYGFGAGVQTQLEEGQKLEYGEDGSMIITGFDRRMDDLVYFVGTVSDHTLTLNDNQQFSLRDLCGRNAKVRFRYER